MELEPKCTGQGKMKMGERTAKMLAKKLQQVGSGMVNRHYESNVEKRLRSQP